MKSSSVSTKDNWIKAFDKLFCTEGQTFSLMTGEPGYGTYCGTQKIKDFISQVEKDAIDKTNKRWRLRVNKAIGKKEAKGKITGDWLNDVLECCKGERNLFRFNLREKLSDLLEENK